MEENHLIIFVKNPELGKVKTRLAAGIGNEEALKVYLKLVSITKEVAEKVSATRHVFYSNEIENDDWDEDKFNKHVQEGNNLGERMKNAFEKVFALGAKKAVIVGSDCPQITPEIVKQGFTALNENDVSIGPAKDGGYYLLGMKKLQTFVFDNKEWSTETVYAKTIEDLKSKTLSFSDLPMLSDLDNETDLYLLDES